MFTTKNYEGFQMSAMYQMDQNPLGSLEAANTMSFNAMYKKDAFFFGGALEMVTAGNFGAAGDYDMDPDTEDTWELGEWVDLNDPVTPDDPSDDTWVGMESETAMGMRFGFGYTADEFAVRGFFQSLSNYNGYKDWSASTMGGEAKYHVNADYSVKGAYYMADPNTDGDDDEYALLALGLDRHFGKSQYIYLQYAMMMNGDMSAAALGGPGHGTSIAPYEAGEAPFGISFGMVKKW